MLLDYHVHLERGPYTLDWLEQFLRQGKQRKVRELGIVEHMYRFTETKHIFYNDWVAQRQTEQIGEYIDLLRQAKRKRWPVKIGLEVDYIPGKEDDIAAFLKELPLDFVIGSVHWLGDWCFDSDQATWEGKDVLAVYKEYYQTLAEAAESRLFDVVGHPGNIGYFGHRPRQIDLDPIETEFVDRVKRTRIPLEVNTGGLLRPAHMMFPGLSMLRKMRKADVDVVLSSDAHQPSEVGYAFTEANQLLKQVTFTCTTRFNNRKHSFVALK